MVKLVKKSLDEYLEIAEAFEDLSTKEDLEDFLGYKPSERQIAVLLAHHKREIWNHHYVTVIRDKLGRFISHQLWHPKKSLR